MGLLFHRCRSGISLAAILVSLAIVRRIIAGESKQNQFARRQLYESDDNKNCLDDEVCRFSLGLTLLCITPLLICWNEHQFVRLEKLYNAARRVVRDISSTVEPSETIDGEFVCFNGRIQGEIMLHDDLFPMIKVDGALLLFREIEILQYVEIKRKDNFTLEKQWCKTPQVDPSHFTDKKNVNGNWTLFSDCNQMVSTGRTLNGDLIRFGDNLVTFRAPNPFIGAFRIPETLLDEMFQGERHVHRLGELELIRASQGKLETFKPGQYQNVQSQELVTEGVYYCHVGDDSFVYDGDKETIGSIRLQWRYVKPQEITVAAEAVSPGRPHTMGYCSVSRNIHEPNAMRDMIWNDLTTGFVAMGNGKKMALLSSKEKDCVTNDQWTVAPYAVMDQAGCLPPYREEFLGQLWLYNPDIVTSRDLFIRAFRASANCLWKVRSLSYIFLFFGWCLVFEPISNVFRGSLLQSLLSLTFAVFAFVLATTCCLSWTALSRITARPVQSILIIVTVWAVTLEIAHLLPNNS